MKSVEKSIGYPFELVAGKGLGYNIQENRTKFPFSQRAYGQAKLQYTANVVTGNLVAEDRSICIDDIGSPFQIGYTYNSLANNHATAWKLNAVKKIKIEEDAGWFSYFNKKAPNISMLESDGHEIKYILKEDGYYYAEDYVKGRPYIKFDSSKNQYQRLDPSSHITEIFDMKGNLVEHMDENQNKTQYQYDEKTGELKVVMLPSGKACEIRHEGDSVNLYLVEIDKSKKLLHSYHFKNGNLESSCTSDGYKTHYEYHAKGKLAKVRQSDGSIIEFGYDEIQGKLNDIHVGDDPAKNLYRFTYEKDRTVFTDASGSTTTLTFDEKGYAKEFRQAEMDTTHYEYTLEGQPEKIIYPDGSQESFSYENKSCLLKQHIQRNKETIDYQYSPEEKNSFSQLISKGSMTSGKTRYVYEGPLLRFIISPEGFVKEFDYTDQAFIKNEFAYYSDTFTQSDIPDLHTMEDWKKCKERLANRTHISYEHNSQGQVIKQIAYGESKNDDAVTCYRYDHLGRIIYKSVKTDKNTCLESTFTYNDNGDLTTTSIGQGPGKTTEHSYMANTIKTTHPNGSYEIETFDARNVLVKKVIHPNDGTQENEINFQCDSDGRVHVLTAPDNIQTRQFYDNQNRLRFTLSPQGKLTQLNYHTQNRYHTKIEYADEYKTSDTTTIAQLEQWVTHADKSNARFTSSFFGLNDKIQFSIDAENYLTENQYDSQDNLISVIKYAAQLTDIELEQLKNGIALSREPNRLQDKVITYYYNKDNEKIGEHDARGYLTVFNKDPLGRLTETITYQTPIPTISKTLEQPNDCKNSTVHTYFYYNQLNQCTLEVDAEGYITTHCYFDDGQKQSSIRYENKVDPSWLDRTKPPIPQNSLFDNDDKTTYAYDGLGRLQEIVTSSGKATRYIYDVMDNILETYSYDLDADFTEQKQLGDIYRGHAAQFNGLNQITAEANANVCEKLKLISLNNCLTDEEKETQKAELWKNHSTRHQYNATGLKIKTIDSLGHATLYYYDQDGNCRLTIDPMGAVSEKKYNTFGDIIEECQYYHRIDLSQLPLSKDGYIHDALQNIIKKDPARDVVTKFERDKRGQVTKKIDPEFHHSIYTYDAFKHCISEQLPISHSDPSLHINHEFDASDHEIKKTIKPLNEANIIVEMKYDHFSGVMTELKDELGAKTVFKPDNLGRVTQVDKEVESNQFITELTEFDAFSQITKATNANHQTTDIRYDQKERTTTIYSPEDSLEVLTKNIFGEQVQRLNAELEMECHQHAPDGQVTLHSRGQKVTRTFHNLLGQEEKIIDASNIITQLNHNASGQLTDQLIQSGDEQKQIHHKPNALGQSECETDALGTETLFEYDRCSQLSKKIIDPGYLNVTTAYVRNSQGSETSRIVGDDKHSDNLNIATSYDNFGRMQSEIVDPNISAETKALNIESYVEKDAAGNIIKKIDPNGNQTRFYYNKLQQKRYELKPLNDNELILTEWLYTPTGKVRSVRVYHSPIQKNAIIDNIAELAISDDHQDTVNLYYYDAKDRERFHIQLFTDMDKDAIQAKVSEKNYDHADREIEQVMYSLPLNAETYQSWDTEQLKNQLSKNPDTDRINYFLYDTDSNLRFTIDQNGRVVEKIYDKTGKVITQIQYATPLIDHPKTIDEISRLFKDDHHPRNQIHHTVYDAWGREAYTISPNGAATRKDYDINDNLIRECLFKEAISPAQSYETLVKTLEAREPDRNKDTITESEYDVLGFVISTTDALGHKDVYQRDSLGNLLLHIDREGHHHRYHFDRAKRLVEEISPPTKIAIVQEDEKGKLNYIEKETTITKKTGYDNNGNTTSITEGILEGNLPEEMFANTRAIGLSYTPQNQLAITFLSGIDIHKKTVWNEHGKEIVEIDESGNAIFHIYDNAGRLLFNVDAENAVTEYRYNAFNQQTAIISYAKKWDTDLSPYHTTGLSLAKIRHEFKNNLTPEAMDRIKAFEYDLSGKLLKVKSGSMLYYSNGELGVAEPEYTKEYSLLGDCVVESTLISPGVWSKKYSWYEYKDQLVAEVDENNYLTLYSYNTAGKLIERIEFANPLSMTPTLTTEVENLKNSIEPSEQDRVYQYEYDRLGQKITEKLVGAITEKLIIDENTSKPRLEKQPKTDLIRRFEYNALEHETKITHEDGGIEQKFYDARNIKVAETQVSRQGITPMTKYKPNAFGQIAVTQTSTKGCKFLDDKHAIPEFIENIEANLIQTVLKHDKRGLITKKQDAEGNLFVFTYTPTRNIACEMHELFQWQKPSALDEKHFKYNKNHLPIKTSLIRDGIVINETFSSYNVFGDFIGESNNDQSWQRIRRMDAYGNNWFAIDEDGPTIKLFDLRGAETMRFKSPNTDLRSIEYKPDDFQKLLAGDPADIEHTESVRDNKARIIAKKIPLWFKEKKSLPTHSYHYDRWNNITQEIDSSNHAIDYTYNHHDQPILRVQPETTVVDEHGSSFRMRPSKSYGYDRKSRNIGSTDANLHTHGQVLDEAGQVICEILADGTRDNTYCFDALGSIISITDANNNTITYQYDKLANVIAEFHPLPNYNKQYEYDQLQHRISDSNIIGHKTRYNHDIHGNVIERYLPLGQLTRTVWDHNGLPLQVINPDGDSMSWERDYFGNITKHFDLENREYSYQLNFKNQVVHQTMVKGGTWTSIEPHKKISYYPEDSKNEYPNVTFSPNLETAKPQNIHYTYAYGLIKSINDEGLGKCSTYEHDDEGRPQILDISTMDSKPISLYRIETTRDELGRESKTTDERLAPSNFYSKMSATNSYDAANNRRNINIIATPAGYSIDCKPEPKVNDSWNLYDEADRTKLSDGVLSNGQVQLFPSKGLALEYKNGRRAQEKKLDAYGRLQISEMVTDQNNRIKSIQLGGLKTENGFSSAGYPDSYSLVPYAGMAIFNANGWQTDLTNKDVNTLSFTNSQYFQQGVSQVDITRYLGDPFKMESRVNEYLRTDDWHLNTVNTLTINMKDPQHSIKATAGFAHDSNGVISGKYGAADEIISGDVPPNIVVDTTPEGWSMNKQIMTTVVDRQTNYLHNIEGELKGGYRTEYQERSPPILIYGRFVNNEKIVNKLLRAISALNYSSAIHVCGNIAVYFSKNKVLRDPAGNILFKISPTRIEISNLPVIKRVGRPWFVIDRKRAPELTDKVLTDALALINSNIPDFMHRYSAENDIKPIVSDIAPYPTIYPITTMTLPNQPAKCNPLGWDHPNLLQQLGPQTYIVRPGETFKTIAKHLGDKHAATQIANINGFPLSSSVPKAGMILRIPHIVPAKNKAFSHRPDHDFLRVIAGNLSPAFKAVTIPYHRKKHNGFLKSLIKVIAITLVCVAAPALATFFITTGGISAAVLTGVFAAIGDASVQGLAIGFGIQEHFSFNEVIETAITAGVTGSLSEVSSLASLGENTLIVASAAVATQLVEMELGLRDKFDTKALLTQIAASVSSSLINKGLNISLQNSGLATAAKKVATSTANALLGSSITHTPIDIQNLAADMLGTYIGDNLGSMFNGTPPINDLNLPDIDINPSDPRWGKELSKMASEQRQPVVQNVSKAHGYLTDPDRQERYRGMFFKPMPTSAPARNRDHKDSSGRHPAYDFGKNNVYRDALEEAAARTGFEPPQIAAIINAEALWKNGIWNPFSKNKSSGALGLTQFLESTWIGEAERSGTALNELAKKNKWINNKGEVFPENRKELLALRADPNLSIMAAAEYMKYNIQKLDASGLIPATATLDERIQYGYIAHHEGLGGAKRFIRETMSEDQAGKRLFKQIGDDRKAKIWQSQYKTNGKAYHAWFWSYTKDHVDPERYRMTRGNK